MATFLNSNQTTRKPRYTVTANDALILDSTKVSITQSNNFHSDRCTIEVILGPDTKYPIAWWGSQDEIELTVRVGFLADGEKEGQRHDEWTIMFAGRVDHIDVSPHRHTIELEARDHSADLMDAKTAETFTSQTSSQVARTLAARHGLQADVQDTSALVGEYLRGERDKIKLNSLSKTTTEWNMLVFLAQQEGFDVFVTGHTLHFKQPIPEDATPYLVYDRQLDGSKTFSNVNDLRLRRDLHKGSIKVTVKSWNHKQKKSFVVTVGSGKSGTPSSSGASTKAGKSAGSTGESATEYVYVIPNLSLADATKEANQRLAYLTKLERIISYSEPGNLDYGARDNVLVDGTGSSWDGKYFVEERTISLSNEEGFRTSIRAKNHSTRSQVTV